MKSYMLSRFFNKKIKDKDKLKRVRNFEIGVSLKGEPYIHCLNCNMKSYYIEDIKHFFGACCGTFFYSTIEDMNKVEKLLLNRNI